MIELFNGYAIDADSNQFIFGKKIKRKVVDKDTKAESEVDALESYGYYPSLGTAFNGAYKFFTRELVHDNTLTVKEALAACKEIENRLLDCAEAHRLQSIGKGVAQVIQVDIAKPGTGISTLRDFPNERHPTVSLDYVPEERKGDTDGDSDI